MLIYEIKYLFIRNPKPFMKNHGAFISSLTIFPHSFKLLSLQFPFDDAVVSSMEQVSSLSETDQVTKLMLFFFIHPTHLYHSP